MMSVIMAALVGVWNAESSRSLDARAFEPGRSAVGPIQITRILAEDLGLLPYWPHGFNNERDPTKAGSLNRHAWLLAALKLEQRLGRTATARELQLAWRYGYQGCLDNDWTDPEGYLEKCRKENGR